MNNDNIKCVCGETNNFNDFKKHFKKCKSFLNKFGKFDFKMRMLLKEYIVEKEDFILMRFILKVYSHLISKIIDINNQENTGYIYNQKNETEEKLDNSFLEKEKKFKVDYNNEQRKNVLKDDNIYNNNVKPDNNLISNNKNIQNFNNNINFNFFEQENDNIDKNIFKKIEDLKNEYKKNNKKYNERNGFNLFENNKDNGEQKIIEEFHKYKSVNPIQNNNNNIEQNFDYYRSQINPNNNRFNKKGKKIKKSVIERRIFYEQTKNSLRKLDEDDF